VRVLYVNHTPLVSGAERSLLETMRGVRSRGAEVLLACPAGELRQRAAAAGIETHVVELPGIGFGSGMRELPGAALLTLRAALALRALARRRGVDVVHAASPRAGLATILCRGGGAQRIVDVRDALPRNGKGRLVRWLLRFSANAIVFNSFFTRRRFGRSWPARSAVCYPPVELEALLQLPLPSEDDASLPAVLGVIGQITPWKGQDDAIRILALIRNGIRRARLRIVGSVVFSGRGVTYDNEHFFTALRTLARELGVADAVELPGPTDDLLTAFEGIHVLLVPSWEEPFGRVVAEAMAAGVPVVATSRGGPAELIESGRSGFLAEPKRPEAWVEPVSRLLDDRALRAKLASRARSDVVSTLASPGGIERLLQLYGPDKRAPANAPLAVPR
jgi:glycosyltransferase involved in cell wall biosynthesis